MKLYIKNMACESCKIIVRQALDELNLTTLKIDLGEVEIKEDITDEKKKILNSKIKRAGLELLISKQGVLIEKIRKVMVDSVYNSDEKPLMKFSSLLSRKLHHSYAYLAGFFSDVQAITIEKYIISLKVERIKELILDEEFTLSEIAHKLHYSNVSHLSNQFKKVTGLTPSHFKKLIKKRTITIQTL